MSQYDLVVIGAGPGGYVCATKAAQLGLNVACIEKNSLGGTCLNVGCIPSKALLNTSHHYHQATHDLAEQGIDIGKVGLNLDKMMDHKNSIVKDLTQGIGFLLKKNKVTLIQGTAQFQDPHTLNVIHDDQTQTVSAKHIVIATGSTPRPLPGVDFDETTIVSSTGALSLPSVPKKLMVIGGGYIGLELGSVWQRLGSDVHVVEYGAYTVPQMDRCVGKALQKTLEKQGLSIQCHTEVVSITKKGNKAHVVLKNRDTNEETTHKVDVALVSVGRLPHTADLNLDKAGLSTNDRGLISVDHNMSTTVPHIHAIGDVVDGPMLAHKAEEEGVYVAERLAGKGSYLNHALIPSVIYTHPEVASVGLTEQQAKDQNIPHTIGQFPFAANSRARATGATEGFVKLIAHAETDEVLGCHIIGDQAGTLIGEVAMAMSFKGSSEDIARTCHAHPTLSEAIKEAALDTHFKAIHK